VTALYSFTSALWEYPGPASWFFLSLPEALADEVAEVAEARAAAFGSVRVEVSVGSTTWRTSLFPDRSLGTYLLPVKKSVRRAEGLEAGDDVDVHLRLADG
jgi:hypothetical protein